MPSPLVNLPMRHLALELERLRALIDVRLQEIAADGLGRAAGGPVEQGSEGLDADQPDAAFLRSDLDGVGSGEDAASPVVREVYAYTRGLEAAEARAVEATERVDRLLGEVPQAVLPLCILERRFGLDPEAMLLLLLAAAPAFDPQAGDLFSRLHRRPHQTWPSLALLQELAATSDVAPTLTRLLSPDAPLVRYRLLVNQRTFPDLPDAAQPLLVDDRVIRFLRGELVPDPDLSACVALLHELPPERDRLFLPEPEREPWARLLEQAASSPPPLIVLRGPAGIGRRRRALEIARRAGRTLLCADLDALHDLPGGLTLNLRIARREALMQDAHLALIGWERLLSLDPDGDDPSAPSRRAARRDRLSRALAVGLRGHPHPVALVLDPSTTAPSLPSMRAIEHAPCPLDGVTALSLWRFVLPRTIRHPALDLDTLASTWHLTPGQIHDAIESARDPAQPDLQVHPDDLRAAVKRGIAHRLGDNASLVERGWSWQDLILQEEVMLQLQEFVHRFRFRDRVLQQWGLGRRFGDARGLSALFEGPPGTGKTMSASVIASDLGLDLYQIDLSRIVSRYIGETEKNLGRVFDEAERAQAMLLFDEADALFSKRTEVKSSNDRYANMEVNYLLQRLEAFTGVVILTTNFGASIDDAFARRLSLRVAFPKPGAPEREALWRSMLQSDTLPLGPINFAHLAEQHVLSGGHIKNAVLRAAFLAAARDQRLDERLLETAARMEMRAQGMLVHGED